MFWIMTLLNYADSSGEFIVHSCLLESVSAVGHALLFIGLLACLTLVVQKNKFTKKETEDKSEQISRKEAAEAARAYIRRNSGFVDKPIVKTACQYQHRRRISWTQPTGNFEELIPPRQVKRRTSWTQTMDQSHSPPKEGIRKPMEPKRRTSWTQTMESTNSSVT